jgi:hypothetical protein
VFTSISYMCQLASIRKSYPKISKQKRRLFALIKRLTASIVISTSVRTRGR